MCFCHTIASRYGALAGFGLSLTKWTLIVKHSTDLASRENSWLWWLIMAFGLYNVSKNFLIEREECNYQKKVKMCNDIYISRSFNLRTCHHSILKHQTWLETTVRKRTGASTFFLLKIIKSAPFFSLLNLALEQTAFLCGVIFV